MIRCYFLVSKWNLNLRYYSLKTSTEKRKSYKDTVFLPKTNFPAYIKPNKVSERDSKIKEEAKFLEFYNWQRENLKGEFVLHDGPPYANGKPHIGHAVNKILKDIILRSQVVQGKRVHFKPGWDCHGLPIELTALKNNPETLSPMEIRKKAKEHASNTSLIQMEAFKDWGVMGDWNNQCYYTFDTNYVVNELQIFWKLYQKGLIFYDLKPVYWSPSSKSALAEAELIYKDHDSLSLIVKFETVQNSYSEPVNLLVWTTTPWTLPLNKAVYCSSNLNYSIVRISSLPGLYVVATDLIHNIQQTLEAEITKHSTISSKELISFKYKHPWHKNELMNIFEAEEVKTVGTGFFHSVPGCGHEDFLLGLKNNLKLECFIDENGLYSPNAGDELAGLDVMNEGSNFVIDRLSSDIISQKKYTHSYPYDWRTNKPVVIRACYQWFIDCDKLKNKAIKLIENMKIPSRLFKQQIESRQYWCLSRQRKWGVPIPIFFHKISSRPLVSYNLIQHICQLFESSGPDVWWTASLDTLFPKKFCDEFFVKMEDVIKSEDILDIWFDSGVSWSYALNGKKSEVYLEGVDQYSGWFQTSLLTSVAVQNDAPFKKILTHGFTVDETGKKMSKSFGNVLDPETVIKGENALGVDTLRWWVALRSFKKLIPCSTRILNSELENIKKFRQTFRFLLGALNEVSVEDTQTCNTGFTHLDRYLLNACYKLYHSIMENYNSYCMYNVCSNSLHFVTSEVSARYLTAIKDRLYCDHYDSARRKACQYTLAGILDTLCYTLAPILPHLVEEVYSYHSVYGRKRKFFYNKDMWSPPKFWKNDSVDACIQLVDEIKAEIRKTEKEVNISRKYCVIRINKTEFEQLKRMQGGNEQSMDSELTELLQVAEVRLEEGDRKIECFTKLSSQCVRCRRHTAPENEELCKRCQDFVS